jgi:hypothetical protein
MRPQKAHERLQTSVVVMEPMTNGPRRAFGVKGCRVTCASLSLSAFDTRRTRLSFSIVPTTSIAFISFGL